MLNTRSDEAKLLGGSKPPRHGVLDNEITKTAAESKARGFYEGKKIKGCLCRVAVDSQSTLLAVHAPLPTKTTVSRRDHYPSQG